MKNRLIAVAFGTLLAGGAAAQSQAVLYGELDAGLGQRYKQSRAGLVTNFDGMSRWGIRGAEDLGGGLAAQFQLESGSINLTDGSINGGGGMNRQSWVGLGGGFGSVMFGRTTTPQNRIMGVFDLNDTADGSSALLYTGLAANSSFGGSRQSSQIQYALPKVGALQARVAYVFRVDRGGSPGKAFLQGAARYQSGALTTGVAVQGRMSRADGHRTGYALGAMLDLERVVVSALYTQRETKAGGQGLGLGVAVPLDTLTVGAQVAQLHRSANAQVEGATAFELFADYNLSKRTRLYANFGTLNDDARWLNGTTVEGVRVRAASDKAFAAGVVHRF